MGQLRQACVDCLGNIPDRLLPPRGGEGWDGELLTPYRLSPP